MNNKPKLSVIGGDSRQIYAAEHFIKLGYQTNLFGCELENITDKNYYSRNLSEALKSKYIILPLPLTKNNKTINTPLSNNSIFISELIDEINEDHSIFLGMGNQSIIKQIKAKTSKVYDYFTYETLIYKNALLTAEGIISIISDKLPVTISGLRVAVTGYGRIAAYTAAMLKSLNADVTIFARNKLQLTKAELEGLKQKNLSELEENAGHFDCIVNTVPQQVINGNIIKNTSKDCILIETASAPYGIDFAACTFYNRNLIKAFSLPGKTSPKSAGIIIADTVDELIKEV